MLLWQKINTQQTPLASLTLKGKTHTLWDKTNPTGEEYQVNTKQHQTPSSNTLNKQVQAFTLPLGVARV